MSETKEGKLKRKKREKSRQIKRKELRNSLTDKGRIEGRRKTETKEGKIRKEGE